jgi:hypothetical protein
MAPNREIGPPSARVPPADNQVPEPRLWPLLYDLNGKVTRMDEAVDGLKERVSSLDRRLEILAKDTHDMAKDISAAKGSINTIKWVFGLLVPVLTVLLTVIAKRYGYL